MIEALAASTSNPIVVRNAHVHITYGTGNPPVAPYTVVDLSCDAVAVEIGSDTENVDVGTFCAPTASDLGRTTYTAVLSALWSPELYAKLAPHVGQTGWLALNPDQGLTPAKFVHFRTRYGALPWGRFEIGQRVDVDLALAVLDAPIYDDNSTEPSALAAPAEAPAA